MNKCIVALIAKKTTLLFTEVHFSHFESVLSYFDIGKLV